jgi:hypothetical protein
MVSGSSQGQGGGTRSAVDLLLPLLAGIAVALLIGISWTAMVAFVCWDVYHSALPAGQQRKWAVLSLIPFIGFALYLARRRELSTQSQWETMLRPQRSQAGRDATVAAVAYAAAQQERAPHRESNLALPCLYATKGPYEGQEFVVDALPATIGRGSGVAIRLDRDPGVSRQHAELYRRDGTLWLRDLGSTHGTLVNDAPAADQELVPGDTIVVGLSRLLFKGMSSDGT